MKNVFPKLLISSLLSLILTGQVMAGSQNRDETVLSIEDLAVLSKKVERVAAGNSARVFFMARVGRPLNELPDGIEYTHVSYAVYSSIKTKDGRTVPGYAIYNLYQRKDDPEKSNLVVDFPIDFLAGAHAAKVGVIIPTPELQERLLKIIGSDTYKKLHNTSYSAISNPYNAKYQNCTEHVLDVLNAAIYQTDNIGQLKANTKRHFKAQPLNIGRVKLFFGSLFHPDVKTSDHKGAVQTTTFGSIARYLEGNGLAKTVVHVEL